MAEFLRSTRLLWPASVVFALVVGLGIVAAVGCGGSGSDDPTPTPTDTPAPTTAPRPTATFPPTPCCARTFGDGTYRVGIDIPPGTFRTEGTFYTAGQCVWQRLSGFSGSLDDQIEIGGTESSRPIVTILPSDAGFSTEGCGTWRLTSY
jgi:hypothetical protein